MPSPPRAAEQGDLFAAATDPRWRAFKDAAYGVLVKRALERDAGEEHARLAQALAGLPRGDWFAAGAFDAGIDVGRHVLAKRLVEDSVPEALAALAGALDVAGLAKVEADAAFHRSFTLRIKPGPEGSACEPSILAAYVAGLLRGFFGEAFNCQAEVRLADPWTFAVRLAEGRAIGGGSS